MGTLYIIATPLGNLGDITLRALETLKSVDLVACEDTRETIKLLNHYNISKPLVSYFQHSKLSKIEYLAGELSAGKNIALVTDAGTPGISDPGGKLVHQLVSSSVGQFETDKLKNRQTEKLNIVPIPGPCAAIAALSISGFPTDKFIFMGFPPHKKGRDKYFKEVAAAKETVVFYESTHRILKTLEQLAEVMRINPPPFLSLAKQNSSSDLPLVKGEKERGLRQLVVCRELTKMFESIYRGAAEEILKILESDKNSQKGEFVIIVNKI